MNIPIAKTNLLDSEIESVLSPLYSGWLVQGPRVKEFEDKWSAFTNADHSIAVTSCTSALHLSLAALGFGPEDEAIVPAFTWISTANIIEHLGGRVVFCDIDLETFNLDISALESKVTKRTKAILPVHLFGLPADMDPIVQLANKYNLRIVEDAACGFGSLYKGMHVGNVGDTGCFSFHPRKAITTGEGGMVTTNDEAIATKIRRLRDHGAEMTDLQRHHGARPYLLADHPDAGYNQRMTDLQGALGSSQMDRAHDIVEERRAIADRYNKAFQDIPWLNKPFIGKGFTHGYQSYPCLFEPEGINENSIPRINSLRNSWMDQLQEDGISTRPATHAVHMLSYYRKKYRIESKDFPQAYAADQCSISFPLFHGMKEDEQDFVIEKVLEYQP
ncbi:DegT/DnrJ/EryC1/StrS family aminotransferase [Opitutales bacterium]|nr:DegT/DnrJ/EryC1/StrS family aminotransferase [Opitutales bacterium]